MIRSTAILCLALCGAAPCVAAESKGLKFSKTIERTESDRENILSVPFDGDVYESTRGGFPDLRIFDGKNQETPYVLERATESRVEMVRQPCGSRVVSLKEQQGGIEVLVQLDADAQPAQGLTLATPLANYERHVQVSGSEDGKEWKSLVSNGLVFDYSRYMDVSNREIRLPKNQCRQFRIAIDNITDERESPFLELTRKSQGGVERERIERTMLERRPMRIDRLDFWGEVERQLPEQDKQVNYPVVQFRAENDKPHKQTIIYVRTRREPITALTLQTASRNFNRMAAVQTPVVRAGQTEWRDVGAAQISLVQFGKFHREQLQIVFPEQRQSEYRITIQNADNPPLEVTGVSARGNAYRVVFLGLAKETYRLEYGSDDAAQPSYDAAVVLLPLRQGNAAVEAKLGPQAPNLTAAAPLAPPAFSLRSLLNDVRFLGPAIAVLVIVLGWALVRAARRINELQKE